MIHSIPSALTIAGSDSSGGAGIQADIKTMTCLGVFATSAITALTAQNTTGVTQIMNVTPTFLEEQLKLIFEDIRPDAVKIGMVSSSELIHTIYQSLKKYKAQNIVLDPVMVATSGAKLIDDNAIASLKELMSIATVMTPNLSEAEIIADMKIHNKEDMLIAGKKIVEEYGVSVLIKGGHLNDDADDLLVTKDSLKWYSSKRIDNNNTHGTGCTLSSAIASYLAKDYSLEDAISKAKDYLTGAIASQLDIGKGRGPLNHMYNIREDIL